MTATSSRNSPLGGRSALRHRGVVASGMFGLIAAVVATACGGTKIVTVTAPGQTVTVTAPAKTVRAEPATSGFGAPKLIFQFGYIASLTRAGAGFELRFDPAWFLSGDTANIAAAQDGAVEPGEPVPNDNYIVDEGHRLLTYLVPANAHVAILTHRADNGQVAATPITVTQLAQIVHANSDLKLFEPITTGFWITVNIDTVHSLDQEYRA
jgi:hypothetical protein